MELDADGNLVDVISEPSADVEFTLVAAVEPVIPVNPVTPAASSNSSTTLPNTGSAPAGMIGIAAFLALAGAASLVLRKKISIN